MAEKTLNDVIKALNQNARDQAYDAMEDKRTQEQVLKEIAGLNKMLSAYFMKEKAGAGDDLEAKREAQEKSAKRQKQENKGGTFKSGLREGLGLDFLKNLAGLPGMLFGGVLGGTLMSTLLPAFGKILGRTLLRGPLFGALALFGEDLIKKGVEKLTGATLSDEEASSFNTVLKTTLLGSIFGLRGALAGFVAGVVGNSIEKTFGITDDEKQKLLGIELPIGEKSFAAFGAAIAAFFAPAVITGAIRNAFTGKPEEGGKLKDSHKKRFNAGFLMRRGLGWGSVLLALGGVAGTIIGDQLGSDDAKDTLTAGLNSAAVGWLLGGPWGAVIAGIGFLAYSGMSALGEWFRNRDSDIRNQVFDKFKKYENLSPEDLEGMDAVQREEANLAALRTFQEADRASRLALSKSELAKVEELKAKAMAIRGAMPLEDTINEAQTTYRLNEGLKGDVSKIDELLRYYQSKGIEMTPSEIKRMATSDAISAGIEDIDKIKALEDLYIQRLSAIMQQDFANPNFELPTDGFLNTASKRSLIGRLMESRKMDTYQNLLPPRIPSEGSGSAIIDGSTTTNNHSSNGVLLPAGPAVDGFEPYAT